MICLKDQDSIASRVHTLDRLMRQNLDVYTGGHPDKATMRQIWVLGYIVERDEQGLTTYQKDIEKYLGISRSTASEMLYKMESNGMIERVQVASDGRLRQLVVTEKTLSKMKYMDEVREGLSEKMIQGLSEKEINTFNQIMDKLIFNMRLD